MLSPSQQLDKMNRYEWIDHISRLEECARAASDRLENAILDGAKYCRYSTGDRVEAFGEAYTVEAIKPVVTTSKLLGNVDFYLYGKRDKDKFSTFFALESQCKPLA